MLTLIVYFNLIYSLPSWLLKVIFLILTNRIHISSLNHLLISSFFHLTWTIKQIQQHIYINAIANMYIPLYWSGQYNNRFCKWIKHITESLRWASKQRWLLKSLLKYKLDRNIVPFKYPSYNNYYYLDSITIDIPVIYSLFWKT